MKINNTQTLEKMNFSDFEVLNTQIDKKLKTICFSLSGGWFMKDSNRMELGEGYLKFTGYRSISITAYNAREKLEKVLSEESYERLNEICEIAVRYDEVIIKGFAKETFNWIEFHVVGGIVKGEFVKKD